MKRQVSLAILPAFVLFIGGCRHRVPEGIALLPFKQNGKWGYISAGGKVQISPQFEMAYAFREDRGRVRVNGGYGFINRQGELVIPAIFFDAHDYSEGLARVIPRQKLASDSLVARAVGDTVGTKIYKVPVEYVDLQGNAIIEPQEVDEGHDFHEGYANVKLADWGFIDKTGKVVNESFSMIASDLSEGMAVKRNIVGSPRLVGLQSLAGDQTIPMIYEAARPFSDGLAGIKAQGVWGFVDHTGNVVIPPGYQDVKEFSEGIAPVQQSSGWFYISKTGSLILLGPYEVAGRFHSGLAVIRMNGLWQIIHKEGTGPMLPPGVEPLDPDEGFVDGLLAVKKGDAFGYLRPDASYLWPPSS